MTSIASSNSAAGFIDLATYDELEKYLYGGSDSVAYFVRETRKSTWFTIVPILLARGTGTPDFGNEWSVQINRTADYILNAWLRVTTPAVSADITSNTATLRRYVSWSPNFMHNLVRECAISFNDLVAMRFDSYHLDFWAAFTVSASKQVGYDNMIGNISSLTTPSQSLPRTTLNLPLPLFFTRDSGVALPTAALPYNEIRINFSFRNWTDLLTSWEVIEDSNGVDSTAFRPADLTTLQGNNAPQLSEVQVWSHYSIVSNDERKRMGAAPRDILIEQVQSAPSQTFLPGTNNQQQFDIRFSHAIKALFFAVQNRKIPSYLSNYTTHSPLVTLEGIISRSANDAAEDPLSRVTLSYENTQRLTQMGSDYFSLVSPFYWAPTIPAITGMHLFSYSLDFYNLDSMGSTNYGKLTNVSIRPEPSEVAQTEASRSVPTITGVTAGFTPVVGEQPYSFVLTAVSNNIIRISGGALGFPIL